MKTEIDYKYYTFKSNIEECLRNLKFFKDNKMKNAEKSIIGRFNELNKEYFNIGKTK